MTLRDLVSIPFPIGEAALSLSREGKSTSADLAIRLGGDGGINVRCLG